MGQTAQIEELKSGRKGARQRRSILRNRVAELMEFLEAHVEPYLKTTKKANYEEVAEPVRNLVKRR